MNGPILYWVKLNPERSMSANAVNNSNKINYDYKYPVLHVNIEQGKMLIVLPDGRMKSAEIGYYIVADGIKGLPLAEEVETTVTTTSDFKVLSAEEYRALSAEQKKEYSKAKKEAGL